MRKLSWKPRRNGDIYCAPACGRNCTLAEYKQARERVATLKLILGRGWTARIWENLGWHYCAISPCGRITVHSSHHKDTVSFYASLQDRWTSKQHRNPRTSVREVIAIVKADLATIGAAIEGLEWLTF